MENTVISPYFFEEKQSVGEITVFYTVLSCHESIAKIE